MGKKIWGRRMKNVECRGKKNGDNVGTRYRVTRLKNFVENFPVILHFIIILVIKKILRS